jgi:hypothetical protein
MSTPQGYEAEIVPALWERRQTYHIPHLWFVAWAMALCLLVLAAYRGGNTVFGPGWGKWCVVVALLCWGGVFVWLQLLTKQDPQWDEVAAEDFSQRPQRYYDVG